MCNLIGCIRNMIEKYIFLYQFNLCVFFLACPVNDFLCSIILYVLYEYNGNK